MTEWISVKDRLPEDDKNKKILVYTSKGIHSAFFPDGFMSEGIVGGWESCCYCGGESKVALFPDYPTIIKFTHWMPLPKIPDDA